MHAEPQAFREKAEVVSGLQFPKRRAEEMTVDQLTEVMRLAWYAHEWGIDVAALLAGAVIAKKTAYNRRYSAPKRKTKGAPE